MRRLGVCSLLALVGVVGCSSRGATPSMSTLPEAVTHEAPAPPTEIAVKLRLPAPGSKLTPVRDSVGRVRTAVKISGTAGSQALRVQLSCPARSCSQFVLADTDGNFSASMRPVLPAGLKRLRGDIEYASPAGGHTAASVRVSVRRPRTPPRPTGGSSTSRTLPPSSSQVATIPAPTDPQPVPAPTATSAAPEGAHCGGR